MRSRFVFNKRSSSSRGNWTFSDLSRPESACKGRTSYRVLQGSCLCTRPVVSTIVRGGLDKFLSGAPANANTANPQFKHIKTSGNANTTGLSRPWSPGKWRASSAFSLRCFFEEHEVHSALANIVHQTNLEK